MVDICKELNMTLGTKILDFLVRERVLKIKPDVIKENDGAIVEGYVISWDNLAADRLDAFISEHTKEEVQKFLDAIKEINSKKDEIEARAKNREEVLQSKVGKWQNEAFRLGSELRIMRQKPVACTSSS